MAAAVDGNDKFAGSAMTGASLFVSYGGLPAQAALLRDNGLSVWLGCLHRFHADRASIGVRVLPAYSPPCHFLSEYNSPLFPGCLEITTGAAGMHSVQRKFCIGGSGGAGTRWAEFAVKEHGVEQSGPCRAATAEALLSQIEPLSRRYVVHAW